MRLAINIKRIIKFQEILEKRIKIAIKKIIIMNLRQRMTKILIMSIRITTQLKLNTFKIANTNLHKKKREKILTRFYNNKNINFKY